MCCLVEKIVYPAGSARWRWHVKAALASTISRAHDYGFAGSLARGRTRPLVLGYHRVVDDFASVARTEMPSMLTSTRMFERHLDCVGKHFRFVTLDEIGAHMASGEPFDEPVAAVTFDDGYYDNYEYAFPILKRKGIPSAVFVVTELVGRPLWQVHDKLYHLVAKAFAAWDDPRGELSLLMRALGLPTATITRDAVRTPLLAVSALLPTLPMIAVRNLMDGLEARVGNGFYNIPRTLDWPQLTIMRRDGVTIGSHTKRHVSLPAESADIVAEELAGSREVLERHLGQPIAHFAYPGGQFNAQVVEAVARAGYRFAYTACQHGDPAHRELTIERLLLWEGSSVDGEGRFSPAILNCQAQDLWPPARKCDRAHDHRRQDPARVSQLAEAAAAPLGDGPGAQSLGRGAHG
jgi:peptidoglycan/xylan/chitin deacetylase (PgdA/CDA1 family)